MLLQKTAGPVRWKRGVTILRVLIVPLSIVAIYLLLALFEHSFHFSSRDMFLGFLMKQFDRHGYWLVFVAALIEGFFIIGNWFPGGVVIFLGVISAGQDIKRVVIIVSLVCIAFFISYYLNYLVGKYGWYKLFVGLKLKESLDRARKRLEKHSFNAIILSYWEPNIASVTATAAGILFLPLKKFLPYSLFAIVMWNTAWGVLVHTLGESALKLTGKKYIIGALLIWIAVIVVKELMKSKKEQLGAEQEST
jgi:membrane protein DedA with SNARE-associated domain